MEIQEKDIVAAYKATENEDVRNTIKALFPNVDYDRPTEINLFIDAIGVLGRNDTLVKEYDKKIAPDDVLSFWHLKIIVAAYNKLHPLKGKELYMPYFINEDDGVLTSRFSILKVDDWKSYYPKSLWFNSIEDAADCANKFFEEWSNFYSGYGRGQETV